MLYKDFILDVQKMCHQDNQQCTLLLNALCRMMSQAGVEQVPVTIPGLGTFSSHKHPEYIQEDPMTGRQTLYPPRITYRMQAEDLDAPEGLVQRQLAEISHLSIEETTAFLAAIVQVIYQALEHGEEIEIKGLGSFRNIVTRQGELQRVAYMPDEQMRQRVNAPFNCFEPVAIVADAAPQKIDMTEPVTDASVITEPSLEVATAAIEEASLQTEMVESSPVVSEPLSVISDPSIENSEPTPVEPEPTIADEPSAQSSMSDVTTSKLEIQDESIMTPPSVTTPVDSAPKRVEDPLVERDRPMPARGRQKSQPTALYMLVALVLLICGALVWFIYSLDTRTYGSDNGNPPVYTSYDVERSDLDPVLADSLANESDTILSLEEELYGEPEADSLLWAEEESPNPAEDQPADLLAAANPQSEVPATPSANPQQPANPAAQPVTQPASPTVAQPTPPSSDPATHTLVGADGRPVTHKLESGQMLTQVSLKYFGDKCFWPYIYEVNKSKIRNPNVVPAGIVLSLPDPAFFGIDAANPESVRRAKAKAAALVNAQ